MAIEAAMSLAQLDEMDETGEGDEAALLRVLRSPGPSHNRHFASPHPHSQRTDRVQALRLPRLILCSTSTTHALSNMAETTEAHT